jgi:hypothetical protein
MAMLCLSGCAVDSGAATRLQRGAPAETVIKTVGQRGQFAFLVQLDDGVYEGRLYRVGSADLPYYFIYRNGVLWKITPWRYWDDNFRTASTRLAATEDWPTSCMSELHQILQHSDCRSFPANYSPLLYFPWAAGVCIGVPCAGIILFPFVIGDLVQEPGYAGIVGKFDPEKVYLEESIQDLDRQLGRISSARLGSAAFDDGFVELALGGGDGVAMRIGGGDGPAGHPFVPGRDRKWRVRACRLHRERPTSRALGL